MPPNESTAPTTAADAVPTTEEVARARLNQAVRSCMAFLDAEGIPLPTPEVDLLDRPHH